MATNQTPRGAFTRQASLSDRDVSAASFVRQGVVDQSGYFAGQAAAAGEANKQLNLKIATQGVEGVGKLGIELGKGYVLNSLQNDVQSKVDDFLAFQNRDQHAVEAEAADMQSNALWNRLGDKTSPSNIGQIDAVEGKYKASLNKLTRAYSQGAITSSAQLEAEVLKLTREAVNRTPGMAQELMAHSAQVLHLSGVRGMKNPYEDVEKAQAKQEAASKKRLESYFMSNKLPYDVLDPNYEEMAKTYVEHTSAHQKMEQAKEMLRAGETIEKGKVRDYLRYDAPDLAKATYLNIGKAAEQAFQPGVPFASALVTFEGLARKEQDALLSHMADSGAMEEQHGRAMHKMFSEQTDRIIASVSSYSSNESAAKAIRNQTNIVADLQKQAAMKHVNLYTAKAMSQLSEAGFRIEVKKNAEEISEKMNIMIKDALSPEHWDSSLLKPGVSDVTMLTGALASSDQAEGVTHAFKAIAKSQAENPNASDRIDKLTKHFTELGSSNYKGKIKNSDPFLETQFHKTAKLYLEDVGKMFNNSLTASNKVLGFDKEIMGSGFPAVDKYLVPSTVTARGVINRGGLVEIKVENDRDGKYEKQWERDIAARYNDVIRTYQNLTGLSLKEASDNVMSRYGQLLNIPEEELPKAPDGMRRKQTTQFIKKEEGMRNTAYLDEAGVPTIGYGFTTLNGKPVKMGDTITTDEANEELQRQIPKYQTFKNKIKVDLTPEQETALTSFEYNLGSGIWEGSAKSIIYAINSGDYKHANNLMLQYDKAKDKVSGKLRMLPGLSARRIREGKLLDEG